MADNTVMVTERKDRDMLDLCDYPECPDYGVVLDTRRDRALCGFHAQAFIGLRPLRAYTVLADAAERAEAMRRHPSAVRVA